MVSSKYCSCAWVRAYVCAFVFMRAYDCVMCVCMCMRVGGVCVHICAMYTCVYMRVMHKKVLGVNNCSKHHLQHSFFCTILSFMPVL